MDDLSKMISWVGAWDMRLRVAKMIFQDGFLGSGVWGRGGGGGLHGYIIEMVITN